MRARRGCFGILATVAVFWVVVAALTTKACADPGLARMRTTSTRIFAVCWWSAFVTYPEPGTVDYGVQAGSGTENGCAPEHGIARIESHVQLEDAATGATLPGSERSMVTHHQRFAQHRNSAEYVLPPEPAVAVGTLSIQLRRGEAWRRRHFSALRKCERSSRWRERDTVTCTVEQEVTP